MDLGSGSERETLRGGGRSDGRERAETPVTDALASGSRATAWSSRWTLRNRGGRPNHVSASLALLAAAVRRIRGSALLVLLVAAVVLLGPVGCNRSGGEGGGAGADSTKAKSGDSRGNAEEAGEDEALPVEVALVERGRIEAVVRSATNLEAEAQIAVLAEAARQVRQLEVEEGDVVRKGQLLLRLENDAQQSNLAKAQVSFDQAERELERQQRLFEQNLAAERALSDAQHEHDQARLALEDARRELGYTEVRSPIGGTVTQRLVKLGDQVTVGQQLFEIVDFESLVARVYVPEGQMAGIEPGQVARIRADAAGNAEFTGNVDRIAPVVDPRSGTVKVTVAVGAQPGLLPGMFVDVDIVTQVHENAVILPKRALVYDEDRAYAFKVAGRKAERVEVVPLLADRDSVEPAAGFAAGDTLVVAGQAGLKDGSKVELPGANRGAATEGDGASS